MHKLIFGIFAHPDDEAFGPSGTLLSEVRGGAELHLMTLTAGEKGANPDNLPRLSEVRLAEWRKAGALIGAHTMHHLGHTDGELDNVSMLRASEQIEQLVRDTLASHADPVEVEFMSMDTSGITGHIDHIVASRAAHLAIRHTPTLCSWSRDVCPRKSTKPSTIVTTSTRFSLSCAATVPSVMTAKHTSTTSVSG